MKIKFIRGNLNCKKYVETIEREISTYATPELQEISVFFNV